MTESDVRIAVQGAELVIRPDAGAVVVRVELTGALRGISRNLSLTPYDAERLAFTLDNATRRARELGG